MFVEWVNEYVQIGLLEVLFGFHRKLYGLFQCKDGTCPRKDLDICALSLVVIMMEGKLQSMHRTVPQNLTLDMQVGGKASFYLWVPKLGWLDMEAQSTWASLQYMPIVSGTLTIKWCEGWLYFDSLGTLPWICSPFFKNHVNNVPFVVYN